MKQPFGYSGNIMGRAMAWLVVLSFLFHGLLPLGYMPVREGATAAHAGSTIISICTAGGAEQIVLSDDQLSGVEKKLPAQSKEHTQKPCIFAFNNVHTSAQPFYSIDSDVVLSSTQPRLLEDARVASQIRYGNASPRSPPQYVC